MKDISTRRLRGRNRVASSAAIGAVVAVGAAFAVATPAIAADVVETVTFEPGAQQSFTVPADATSLQVTVAGAQGSTRAIADQTGGAGGTVTVDLGTIYNGSELHLLVGATGSGSYLATDSEFLAIAGGGGSNGYYNASTPDTVLDGGAGGFATASPDGGDGEQYPGTNISGLGAHGATAGAPGYGTRETAPPDVDATPATVVDGVIAESVTTSFLGAEGSGYASGGSARGDGVVAGVGIVRGASGGGSGFLAPGLVALSTGPNEAAEGSSTPADGYITFTWSVPNPADVEPEPTDPGTTPPVTDPAPGVDPVADGEATLAETGASTPWVGYVAALLLMMGGALLVTRRRLSRS